ncbi:hypothetical protein LSAT2_012215 [Lamellibrachia satsuma]|nr:hypothetical protein LSAT2_012215 [Lamellibrachia satsuma]
MQLSVTTALLVVSVVLVFRCVNTFDVDTDTELSDSETVVQKRYTLAPICRHCYNHPEDSSACNACYSRWKPVPYFGFQKRVSDRPLFRAAFLSCKCCATDGDPVCCKTCSSSDMQKRAGDVGGYEEKRGFQTSFYDPQFYSSDNRCYCCRNEAFNYACCLRCLKRRRR